MKLVAADIGDALNIFLIVIHVDFSFAVDVSIALSQFLAWMGSGQNPALTTEAVYSFGIFEDRARGPQALARHVPGIRAGIGSLAARSC